MAFSVVVDVWSTSLSSQDSIFSGPPLSQREPSFREHLFPDRHGAPNSSSSLLGLLSGSTRVKRSVMGCPPPLPPHPTLILHTPHPFNLHHTAQPHAHHSQQCRFPQKPPPCHPLARGQRGRYLFRQLSQALRSNLQHTDQHMISKRCAVSTLV